MSELDLTKFLVSIERYDHSCHFDKVFCLACEYLSSFRIYSSSSLFYNGASSCASDSSASDSSTSDNNLCDHRVSSNRPANRPSDNIARFKQQANSSRYDIARSKQPDNSASSSQQDTTISCSICNAPPEQARTCLKLCEQCFKHEQARLLIEQSKDICERLVKRATAMHKTYEIAHNAKLIELINAELQVLYAQESNCKRIPQKLLCEILAHIIHLLIHGQCLLAMLKPLDNAKEGTSENSSSSVVGILHYETGKYTKGSALLLEQSGLLALSSRSNISSYCYISKVYVRPVCRRLGIATELIHAAGDYCAQQHSAPSSQDGIAEKHLIFLDTIRTFAPALSLYESLSFKHLPAALLPDHFAFDASKMYLYTLR